MSNLNKFFRLIPCPKGFYYHGENHVPLFLIIFKIYRQSFPFIYVKKYVGRAWLKFRQKREFIQVKYYVEVTRIGLLTWND